MGEIRNRKVAKTTTITIFGFLILIVLGGILLYLPISNTQETTWIDSVFTAAASVCISGLAVLDVSTQYTLFGKIVMLILIEIGALGFIAVLAAIYSALKRKFTYKEQLLISSSLGNEGNLKGIRELIRRVISYTAIIEGLGAVAYAIRFVPILGWSSGIANAIALSISSFCNCGYDLFGVTKETFFATDGYSLFVCAVLTILGGLGFIVWNEITEKWKQKKENRWKIRKTWAMLTVHTKLVMVMTVIMAFVGTVGFWAIEKDNPGTLEGYSPFQKWYISAFEGISARTTGISVLDLGNLTNAGKLFLAICMLIGGAPGSMAGGIKTVTLAVLVITMFSSISDNKVVTAYKREITPDIIKRAVAVFLLALFVVLTATILLAIANPQIALVDILFEVISSLATCGYSTGITTALATKSKLLLILVMYIGRVSTVTMTAALTGKLFHKHSAIQYPRADIQVG